MTGDTLAIAMTVKRTKNPQCSQDVPQSCGPCQWPNSWECQGAEPPAQNACQGKGSCVIRILNSAFGGDPCRALLRHWLLRLNVHHHQLPVPLSSEGLVHMYMVAVMEPGAGSILFFCFRAVNDY
ncbi:hypothetical protein CK203_029140 [Vitis vinifera]|uniref:Uncharacterized protein n=1 Tax=Vitis vinifera TaxID=29760 RepID=A0A438ISU1_VITVI|nr:hypothetical protein CK203_029140 [Vitis vinifera]